ncbi:MAG: bifunctional phosphoglucose/phosphomannose isomerase [Ignavibacteria bacterium]|jgi:glucose/mannose-6-phosphate isomerase|nr:bifunctional phosphoglucose/phosphomannose isomerase [Ignavibacteria bacterium]
MSFFDFNIEKEKYDSQDMYKILLNFPQQFEDAVDLGKNAPTFPKPLKSKHFVVLGMGGSAIGADLVKSFLSSLPDSKDIHIFANRNYSIDFPLSEETNVIASSYSGNTEETLAAYAEAKKKTKNIVCICSGGKLEELAKEDGFPIIKIPGGMQPRCAIGYSFFAVFFALKNANIFTSEKTKKVIEESIEEAQSAVKHFVDTYKDFENSQLQALFSFINGQKVPIFYTSSEKLHPIAIRLQNQIQENAKHLAFVNTLPEMNHNEISAWQLAPELGNQFSVFFITDRDDKEKTKLRTKATKEILEKYIPNQLLDLHGNGNSFLARMFNLIVLGDWFSYYFAILKKQDPTLIPAITKLKEIMAR